MIVERCESDSELVPLLARLPEEWAQVPASDDGEVLALAFIRAAYARGYVAGLEESPAQ